MQKLGVGAVLAMTTMLGGAAWGQTYTGSFGDGTQAQAAGMNPSYYYHSYSVNVTDPSTFMANLTASAVGTIVLWFHSGNFDHADSSQSASADFLAETNGTQLTYGSMGGSDGGAPLPAGVYTVLVGTSSYDALFASGTFILTFSGLVIPDLGPTSAEELSALLAAAGGSARLVVLDAQGIARDLGQASIVARGDQLSLELVEATDGDDVVFSSKSETPGLVGNLYTWAQITGFDSEEDNGPGSINGTGFQIGADMAVGTDMVAGLSLGYSDINASDEGFSQDGTLTYLQPYFSYRSGAWQGNASLIFGQGDYDQTSEGGAGTGETDLFAFTFEGGYDMALQNGLIATPMVGLIAGSEDVTGISGTLADAGTESYDFTQASLGARLTSRKPAGTYFAGLHADYLDQDAGTVLTSEFLSENGWSGRIEVGGATQLEGGFGLSTSFDISGIGGSAQTLSGGLRVALQF